MAQSEFHIVTCPSCDCLTLIHINEVNCQIFRHAVYKNNFLNINPHASKEECDRLFAEDKVFGCAKPFRLVLENNIYTAVLCDYI
jgi:hypothetical protein